MYAEMTVRGTKSAKPPSRSQEASRRKTPVISNRVGKAATRISGVTAPRVANAPSRRAAEALVGPAERLAEPEKIGATKAATPQPTMPHHTGRPAFMAKAIAIGNASRATVRPASRSARSTVASALRATAPSGKRAGRGRAQALSQRPLRSERMPANARSTTLLVA